MDSSSLVIFVNGKKVVVKSPDPETTLVQFLRQTCGLTGPKIGCNQGGCGACTVMLSKYDHLSQQIRHYTVNSCLTALLSCHGLAVTTVEGIGNTRDGLHAVQERLAKSHGTQCGFCSPGFVMSMYALLRNNSKPSQHQIEVAVRGNLCRCTGYRPILDGFGTFASTENPACPMGSACCRNKDNSKAEDIKVETSSEKFLPYDPTQDPIFPPELKATNFSAISKSYQGQRTKWFSPITVDELLALRNQFRDSALVCGNTALAIGTNAKESHQKVVMSTNGIPEFHQMSVTSQGLWCGAAVTISQLEQEIHRLLLSEDKQKTRVLKALIDILKFYACTQIKNLASLVGSLFYGKQSDIIPLFIAAGAKINVVSSTDKDGKEIILTEELYRQNPSLLEAGEVVTGVTIPYSYKTNFFIACKQAYRQHFNLAVLNTGMKVTLNSSLEKIEDMEMIFGGESRLIDLSAVSSQLIGRSWSDKLLKEAMKLIGQEMSSLDIAGFTKDSSLKYKACLAETFFYELYCSVNDSLKNQQTVPSSAGQCDRRETRQDYGSPAKNDGDCFKPIPHTSSQLHTTGEAVYVADIPPQSGELQLALVLSTVAHADIIYIDTTEALAVPGVKGYISAADVPGSNEWDGELVFNDKTVLCIGQTIGAIVADTKLQAQIAAKLVKVGYEEKPAIFTMQEAIEASSYLMEKPLALSRGDVDTALSDCDHVIEAEMYCGGQEHFYMETQCALTVPTEYRSFEIHLSTQQPRITQLTAASVLNVATADVTVKVKRVGGAFGGKHLRSFLASLPAAVAANKFGVPVRCVLDRDDDMRITGKRPPLLAKYKVGFSTDGIIKALDVQVFINAGCTPDTSMGCLKKALISFDSAYHIANMRISGRACKTNIPSNTSMRGLTGPQATLIMDNIVREIAGRVGLPLHKVQQMNFYREGDRTIWEQPMMVDIGNLQRCYNTVLKSSNYIKRLEDVRNFNSENNHIKRGLSIQPLKYPMGFSAQYLNQAAALVNIYTDGHVLVSHGGVELGHGINTKMIQIASEALGIPSSKIRLHDMSTDRVPNGIWTANSSTSVLNGSAVLNACEILNKRLEPVKQMMPGAPWEQCIGAAFMMRISLSAAGFYRTPDVVSLDWEGTGTGLFVTYFSYGAAVSEVEVDCTTGAHKVLRSDVVFDAGKSINPAIDVGQIEGAFIQGYGLFCLEDVKIDGNGVTLSTGPGSYKIPTLHDIPKQFNVALLEDSVNEKAVYGSKGVGEPPLFLAGSVFFAAKSAIESAREAAGLSKRFRFDSPLTCEKVRLACPKEFIID